MVVRENPDIVFWTWKAHKQATAWLERDARKREMGCVGVCSPSRKYLPTKGENYDYDYLVDM